MLTLTLARKREQVTLVSRRYVNTRHELNQVPCSLDDLTLDENTQFTWPINTYTSCSAVLVETPPFALCLETQMLVIFKNRRYAAQWAGLPEMASYYFLPLPLTSQVSKKVSFCNSSAPCFPCHHFIMWNCSYCQQLLVNQMLKYKIRVS